MESLSLPPFDYHFSSTIPVPLNHSRMVRKPYSILCKGEMAFHFSILSLVRTGGSA
jgi:hypothetical protein